MACIMFPTFSRNLLLIVINNKSNGTTYHEAILIFVGASYPSDILTPSDVRGIYTYPIPREGVLPTAPKLALRL